MFSPSKALLSSEDEGMPKDIVSASTNLADDADAGADLVGQLEGVDASAVVVFMGHKRDGAALMRRLCAHFPSAEVIGCTTAGEFTEGSYGVGGAVAIAVSRRTAPRAAGALARLDGNVLEAIRAATKRISEKLGKDLRECDPSRYVGLVLLEGLKQKEEAVNDALGQIAPFLSFVGGSAADDFLFQETRIHRNDLMSTDGAALLVLELSGRFALMKTSSFRPRSKAFRVTRADPGRRAVYELDGAPIADVYAGALDLPPGRLDGKVFASHPLGLMIDGSPWIRSPQEVQSDGAIRFACQLIEGMRVHVMDPTDLIDDTRRAFADGALSLGGPIEGAILFNCGHRRVQMEQYQLVKPFRELLRFPTAGFHTFGESWLGHMNHTLTGLLFG
jgi:hypothetical protein